MESAEKYDLTDGEQRTMAALAQRVALEKLNVYQLNVQLEAATKAVDDAQAQVNGALSFLANAKGWPRAQLSNDFKTLTKS